MAKVLPTWTKSHFKSTADKYGDRAFPVAGRWKPPLEQSAARRHLSYNADRFSEPPQNLGMPLFPITSFLTVVDL